MSAPHPLQAPYPVEHGVLEALHEDVVVEGDDVALLSALQQAVAVNLGVVLRHVLVLVDDVFELQLLLLHAGNAVQRAHDQLVKVPPLHDLDLCEMAGAKKGGEGGQIAE